MSIYCARCNSLDVSVNDLFTCRNCGYSPHPAITLTPNSYKTVVDKYCDIKLTEEGK